MLRIVGIQRSESSQQEFVLLQNQGNLRVQLRGHAIIAESAIDGCGPSLHVFSEDAQIPAGMYVMLRTGIGESRWAKTKDGALLFHCFMNRESPVWPGGCAPIHILAPQHSYCERSIKELLKV